MNHCTPPKETIVALLLTLVLMSTSHAAVPNQSEHLGFGLHLFRDEGALDYPGGEVLFTRDGAILSISEGVEPAIRLRAFSGQATLKQQQRSLTAGMSLSGIYAGLGFQGLLYRDDRFSTELDITYTYQRLSEENSSQKVELTLHSWQASLGFGVQLARRVMLIGGGVVGEIDGEEVASGTVAHTLSIGEPTRTGAFARIDWRTDATGHVGLEWHDHLYERIGLYFARSF